MDHNVSPYYDDFDESKNYLRILFRPGRSVQGRELTQLQTSLQNQIKKFGNHILVDGTPVLNAKMKVDFEKNSIVLSTQDGAGNGVIVSEWLNKYFTGNTSGASGQVTHVDAATRRIFFNYRGGTFVDGETITTFDPESGASTPMTATAVSHAVGVYAYQETGVIYVGGHFVHVPEQAVLVDAESNEGSHLIGFEFTESVKTYEDDISLLDPANGAPNHNAPGADRYNGSIVPKVYGVEETFPDNFYTLIVIENGNIIKENQATQYAAIMDTMARRTYDESGNYTVRDFPLLVNEHPTDSAKVELSLEPGKAYVLGYENETIVTTKLDSNRARTTANINNEALETVYGPYVRVAYNGISPRLNKLIRVHNKPVVNLYSGSKLVGTARAISMDRGSDGNLRIYLADYSKAAALFASIDLIREAADTSRYAYVENGLYDISAACPIYSLSQQPIESIVLNEANYDVVRSYHNWPYSSSNSFVLTADDNYTSFTSESIIAITDQTGAPIPATNYSVIAAGSSNLVRATLTINITIGSATTIDVVVRQYKSQGNPKQKTITQFVDTFTLGGGETTRTLPHFDIFRLVSVRANGVEQNIANYSLDDGQYDCYYDFGKVSGLTAGVAYDITYDYFAHSGSGDYFCVNSYTHSNNTSIEPDIYKLIPQYVSDTGLTFELRNSIDFRRTLTDNAAGTDIARPGGRMNVDYQYYLARKDRVFIDKTGEFHILNGVPGIKPELPESMDSAMLLYNIAFPAYTFESGDVEVEHVDNQRYTMRDIGKLEKRIDVIEYYTSLSLLESSADSMSVVDGDGLTKHKNGMLVDSFVGHGIGNTQHVEYRCTMDSENGVLRTPFAIEMFDLVIASGSSNMQTHEHIATVAYDVRAWISQLLCSEFSNVNPYNVFNWIGQMTLTPSTDNWTDTTRLPAVTTNFEGANDAMTKQIKQMESLGYMSPKWNSWQTDWVGSKRVTARTSSVDKSAWNTTTSSNTVRGYDRQPFRATTTTTTNRRSVTTTTNTEWTQNSGQRRTGTTLQVVPGTITKSTGDRVIETTLIPWMRTKEVKFVANGMKPNTRLYAKFDGTDVTAHCKPNGGSYGATLTTNSAGTFIGYFRIPAGVFRTGSRLFRLEDDVNQPTTSAEFTYQATGLMETKQESIISVDNPQLVPKTVSETKVIQTSGAWQSTSTRTETGTSTSATKTTWYDPLAQSFIVAEKSGVFIKSIDLFFKTKDYSLPVSVFVVETENGYPSQRKLPFSEVTLVPANVNVDPAGRIATTFTFSDPVYLQGETEYAFVVMSNSNKYEAFVGKIGGNQFKYDNTAGIWKNNGAVITKQPYTGVMFKSQNSSTWSADQERDMKFQINRCVFNTNEATFNLECSDLVASGQNNFDLTTMMLNIDTIKLSDTSINYRTKLAGGNYQEVENKTNYDMATVSRLSDVVGQVQPIVVEAKLKSAISFISPIINLQRNSFVGVSNILTDISGETIKNAGTYVSYVVNLADPSDDLRVYLDTKQPGNSEVNVYFKTTEFIPRTIETLSSIGDQYKGGTFQVYWRNGTTLTYKASFIASAISGTTMTIGQLTDINAFVDGGDFVANGIDEILIIRSNSVTMNTLSTWVAQDWPKDSVVSHNGGIYLALGDIKAADGEPVITSVVWQVQPHTSSTALVVEAESAEWREMEAINNTNNPGQFTEKTYIPKADIDSEFSSFSIKIELRAYDAVNIPSARAMRALAMF
jgi:hypothetical protein